MHLLQKTLIIGVTVFCCQLAGAQPMSTQDAAAQGGQIGKALNPSVTQGITSSGAQNIVPSYNTTAPQQELFQGGRGATVAPGQNRVAGCTDQNDLECQAVNMLRQGAVTRPQFDVKNDPIVSRGKQLTKNPQDLVGDMFSAYESCHTTTKTVDPIFETQICNEFSQIDEKVCRAGVEVGIDPDFLYSCLERIQTVSNASCTVGRVVEVDALYNYQCNMTPNRLEHHNCQKTLIVQCQPPAGDGCDSGGIVPGSTQGDMRVWFGGIGGGTFALEFGTFADNYWDGWGAIYDRTLNFNIGNRDSITQFSLVNASFDDWLLLRVNGHLVYVGPYGGDRLEVVPPQSTPENRPRQCGSNDEGGGFTCYTPGPEGEMTARTFWRTCSRNGSFGWLCSNQSGIQVQYGPNSFRGPELNTS